MYEFLFENANKAGAMRTFVNQSYILRAGFGDGEKKLSNLLGL